MTPRSFCIGISLALCSFICCTKRAYATSAPLDAKDNKAAPDNINEVDGVSTEANIVENETPIQTDRPGNANSATVVPLRAIQIETSINASIAPDNRHQLSAPTALRIGLTRWMELRWASGIIGIARDTEKQYVHPTDMAFGAKFALLHARRAVPDLAIMLDIWQPAPRGPFASPGVIPEARIAAAWGIGEHFGLLLNAGLDWIGKADERWFRGIYVCNFGFTIPAWQRRLALFAEAYGRVHFETPENSVHQIDAGATFRLTPRWQLDIYSQHPMTKDPAHTQIAIGMSVRL